MGCSDNLELCQQIRFFVDINDNHTSVFCIVGRDSHRRFRYKVLEFYSGAPWNTATASTNDSKFVYFCARQGDGSAHSPGSSDSRPRTSQLRSCSVKGRSRCIPLMLDQPPF